MGPVVHIQLHDLSECSCDPRIKIHKGAEVCPPSAASPIARCGKPETRLVPEPGRRTTARACDSPSRFPKRVAESHMTGTSSSSYPGHSHCAPPAMQRPLSTGSAPPPLPPRQAPGYEQSRPAPTSASSDLARGMRGLQGLRSRGKVQHHRLRQLPPLLTSQLRLVQVQRHDRP
ncbi:hypothetical protein DFP72DRAFT_355188 [Ephemerocybe angulata]|uniref:Uncharacterized protein n=1 Tax=Ephemerocybe angulata TaxID=980116 RepID=A0A8H6M451_9AGAR|nr:hypothetical protein DFP72DRAFT_355188 [Tulosesus angulatus]